MQTMTRNQREANRAARLLAKVRARQLQLAVSGKVIDSARYAHLAQRVRRQLSHAMCQSAA